jgi:hypothetical protein
MTTPDAAQGTAEVYITNATRCSAGTGPGYATGLPWDEAKALVDAGLAVFGTSPPLGAEGSHGPVRPS